MEFSDLKNQYKELKNEIDQSIQDVLNHGRYIKGPEVRELEDDLNSYVAQYEHTICINKKGVASVLSDNDDY